MTKTPRGSVFITGGVQRKALAAALALKEAGVHVTVGDPSRLALSLWSLRVDRRVIYPDPEKNEERFVDFMIERLRKHPVDLFFPAGGEGEINAVSRYRSRFEAVTRVGLPPAAMFEITEDKRKLLQRAMDAGVDVPRSWFPTSLEEALDRANEFTYPALVKPRHSSGGRGIVHVASAEVLREAWPKVHATYPEPIVQEYVPSDRAGLGAAALYNLEAKPVVVFTYRRLREFPIGAGPSTFTESTDDPVLRASATKTLDALGWQGLAMVEFRHDIRDGRPKLIEVNGRYWGSALLPIVSGINFPYLYYQLMTTGRVEPPPPYRVGVRCRWLFPGDTLHFITNPKRWEMNPPFLQFFAKDTHNDPPLWPDPLPMAGQMAWAVKNLFDPGTLRKYLSRR